MTQCDVQLISIFRGVLPTLIFRPFVLRMVPLSLPCKCFLSWKVLICYASLRMRECKLCGNLLPVKRLEPLRQQFIQILCWYLYSRGLFNDAFSVIKIIESNGRVVSDWWTGKSFGSKRSRPNLRRYSRIRLEGLRNTTKNISQDSWSPGRDLNPEPPEYEARVLATRPRRSITMLGIVY
jgi:hypothetical protein